MIEYPGWLNVKKAAQYCSVSERTLREWLAEGLPHSRARGTLILINRLALDQWLEQQTVNHDQVADVVQSVVRMVMPQKPKAPR